MSEEYNKEVLEELTDPVELDISKDEVVAEPVLAKPVIEKVIVEEPVVVVEAAVEDTAVITNTKKAGKPSTEKQALTSVENGTIGTGPAKEKPVAPKAKTVEAKATTVAIHSTRNVVWQGVGKVSRGVNIVSESEAEQWLTRSHATLLTPEEVAREFNK